MSTQQLSQLIFGQHQERELAVNSARSYPIRSDDYSRLGCQLRPSARVTY